MAVPDTRIEQALIIRLHLTSMHCVRWGWSEDNDIGSGNTKQHPVFDGTIPQCLFFYFFTHHQNW